MPHGVSNIRDRDRSLGDSGNSHGSTRAADFVGGNHDGVAYEGLVLVTVTEDVDSGRRSRYSLKGLEDVILRVLAIRIGSVLRKVASKQFRSTSEGVGDGSTESRENEFVLEALQGNENILEAADSTPLLDELCSSEHTQFRIVDRHSV